MPEARPTEQPASEPAPYLAGLRLAGRRVLVVGGGAVAQRRIPALLEAGAVVEVVAPQVRPTIEGLDLEGRLRWSRRPFETSDIADAWYVLACTDDAAVNTAVAAAAEASHVFCVRADDARGGSAVTPATVRAGDVGVGILSGGDPGLSRALRDGIAERLAAGQVAARDAGTRRRGVPGVALVGGGPGDPELITVKGRRLLARADVVIADRLAPQELLADLAPDVEIIDAAKLPRGRSMPQEEIDALIVEHALAGRFVVRLKGGDPFVYGRGYEELQACAAAGVPVTVVPGLTSAVAVPGLAGIPVTHRDLVQEFTVVSGHLDPDDPRSRVDWPQLGRMRGTLVVLMGVHRLARIAEVLVREGRPADTPAAVVASGSLPGQRRVTGTLATIADAAGRAGVVAPAITVIGAVAALEPEG